MLKLTSLEQAQQLAESIPALAVERMGQFVGSDGLYDPDEHGCIVVLQEGDDLGRELPLLGLPPPSPFLADDWLSPFEFVCSVWENGRRIFEATVPLAGDAMLVLIVPDEPWVDDHLRLLLVTQVQQAEF